MRRVYANFVLRLYMLSAALMWKQHFQIHLFQSFRNSTVYTHVWKARKLVTAQDELSPRSRILAENLRVIQLFKKFFTFWGTPMLIIKLNDLNRSCRGGFLVAKQPEREAGSLPPPNVQVNAWNSSPSPPPILFMVSCVNREPKFTFTEIVLFYFQFFTFYYYTGSIFVFPFLSDQRLKRTVLFAGLSLRDAMWNNSSPRCRVELKDFRSHYSDAS